VLEPPAGVGDREVLGAVRAGWDPAVDEVRHLPVGFGAHHWVASTAGQPGLFVTLDGLGGRRDAGSLEAAYAGAAALAAGGLGFVLACQLSRSGSYTVPYAGGALSCVPWCPGEAVGSGAVRDIDTARADAVALSRLHTAPPPTGLPRWRPMVGPGFAAELADRVARPWDHGPFSGPARTAVRRRLDDVQRWTATYTRLSAEARDRPFVATHGQPHTGNQLRTPGGIVFVDWESLALAPRERDLGPLVDAGHADLVHPDRAMIELFDLEWRLAEVDQYATWLSAPHTGNASDREALDGLLEELDRPTRG